MTQNEKLNLARDNAWAAYDRLDEGYRAAADAARALRIARRHLQDLEDAYSEAADVAEALASSMHAIWPLYDESVKQK